MNNVNQLIARDWLESSHVFHLNLPASASMFPTFSLFVLRQRSTKGTTQSSWKVPFRENKKSWGKSFMKIKNTQQICWWFSSLSVFISRGKFWQHSTSRDFLFSFNSSSFFRSSAEPTEVFWENQRHHIELMESSFHLNRIHKFFIIDSVFELINISEFVALNVVMVWRDLMPHFTCQRQLIYLLMITQFRWRRDSSKDIDAHLSRVEEKIVKPSEFSVEIAQMSSSDLNGSHLNTKNLLNFLFISFGETRLILFTPKIQFARFAHKIFSVFSWRDDYKLESINRPFTYSQLDQ